MVDYEKFQKALKHLELQFRNYQNLNCRDYLQEIDREAISESVIQRFEVCFDSLWKVLKRYMAEDLGLSDLPNSPKPVFRIAFENQLFPSVENWLTYTNVRVDTSHDYSETKARAALELMDSFLHDAIMLYSKMSGESWT
jgi:nucleotidyltransferase substrate binding protein (TIGR01987 family)